MNFHYPPEKQYYLATADFFSQKKIEKLDTFLTHAFYRDAVSGLFFGLP